MRMLTYSVFVDKYNSARGKIVGGMGKKNTIHNIIILEKKHLKFLIFSANIISYSVKTRVRVLFMNNYFSFSNFRYDQKTYTFQCFLPISCVVRTYFSRN